MFDPNNPSFYSEYSHGSCQDRTSTVSHLGSEKGVEY